MGWGFIDDDEFARFDPRKHWAEKNNEFISGGVIGADQKKLDTLIAFLDREKTVREIITQLGMKRGEVVRLLTLIRSIRSITLERRDSKGVLSYRVIDFRKKS